MKTSRKTLRFDDVLIIHNGKNQRDVESKEGKYPIFGSAGKVMGYATSYICEAGTTIIGRKGNINTPIFAETEFWNVDTAFGLAAKPDLDKKFLYYFCLSFDFSALNRGTTIPSLVKSELLEIAIPLPPLPEQHRLVAILDEAFEGIATAKANAETNLQNARALFESYLEATFAQQGVGWSQKTLGDLAEFRNGINFNKSSRGNSIKILGVKDFQSHFFAPMQSLDSIIPDGIVPDNDTLQKGDVIFVRSNGNQALIGRCVLVGDVPERSTHSGFTIKARLKTSEVLPHYLTHFLKSSAIRQQMIDGGNGANIKSLNQGTLSRLEIPFPWITEQARMVENVEAFQNESQRLEGIYQQKLTALDDLKKSLLHQAFTGEL